MEAAMMLLRTSEEESDSSNSIPLDSSFHLSPPEIKNPESFTLDDITGMCIQKFNHVMKMHYDLKSKGMDKFLVQKDLTEARQDALKQSMKICKFLLTICHHLSDKMVELHDKIQRLLGHEIEKQKQINGLCREKFITRVQADIRKSFSDTLKLRFHSIFSENVNNVHNHRSFYDQSATETFVGDLVKKTLKTCKRYNALVEPYGEGHMANQDQGENESTAVMPFFNLGQEIQAAGDGLIARNRENLERFQTYITSLIESRAIETENLAKEKIRKSPLMSRKDITVWFDQEKERIFQEINVQTKLVVLENLDIFSSKYHKQATLEMNKKLEDCLLYAGQNAEKCLDLSKAKLYNGIPKLVDRIGKDSGFNGIPGNTLKEMLLKDVDKWIEQLEECSVKLPSSGTGNKRPIASVSNTNAHDKSGSKRSRQK